MIRGFLQFHGVFRHSYGRRTGSAGDNMDEASRKRRRLFKAQQWVQSPDIVDGRDLPRFLLFFR
jgi:hypothetical protein